MDTLFSKIKPEDVSTDPFPHLIFRNAVDPEICRKLIDEYPSVETISGSREVHSNQRFSMHAHDALGDPRVSKLWKQFLEANVSQRFLDEAMVLFKEHLLKEHPDFEKNFGPVENLRAGIRGKDTFKTVDVLIDAQPSVNSPVFRPSSVRGAHLDKPNKLFFGLYYMRHPEDKSEGGELEFYKYKDPSNKHVYSYRNNAPQEAVEFVKKLPYEENTLFITLGVPDAVHGVSARGPAKHPRLFINILAEINGSLFDIPYEGMSKKAQRKIKSMTSDRESDTKKRSSLKDAGFFHTERKSVLMTSPHSTERAIPHIYDNYNVLFPSDLESLTQPEKNNVEALVLGKGSKPLSTELFSEFKNIKIVAIASGSLKKYSAEEALKRSIPIINVSKTYADAVAEHTLMMATAGLRNAFRSHDIMQRGGWHTFSTPESRALVRIRTFKNRTKRIPLLGPILQKFITLGINWLEKFESATRSQPSEFLYGRWNETRKTFNTSKKNLSGATVGIVGYGHVSKKLIALLKPHGSTVHVYSEHLTEAEAERLGVQKVSLELACKADVVTIHRGLSEKTEKSFGRKEIQSLKPGAVFINTSRGKIIDELALIERLKRGDITACLDVFEREPLSKHSVLRVLPNVFLTSHIGNLTDATYDKALEELGKNVTKHLSGEIIEPEYFVNDSYKLESMT